MTTWSPTSLFDRRAYGSENLRPVPQKDFCNTICQKRKSAFTAESTRPSRGVGKLTAGVTSVDFAHAVHLPRDGKRIRKRYDCAVSSALKFWACFP